MNDYTVVINLPGTYEHYVARVSGNGMYQAMDQAQCQAQEKLDGDDGIYEPADYKVVAVFEGHPKFVYVE